MNNPKKYHFNNQHILIAEDDDINFNFLEEIFQPYKLKISRAFSGPETIEKVKNSNEISLILMDIHIPEIDGLTVTAKLREMKINTPIIAQTAFAISSNRKASLEAGCDEYISKPAKTDEILEIVDRLINRK